MSNQSFDVYLTMTGQALLNKMLVGETFSVTRAVISSYASNTPEILPVLEPELLETTQIALTDRGTYTEIELSFNFRELEEDITFSSLGIYGKTDSSNETLLYVAMVNTNSLMTIPAHSPITYVLSLKESLTQGKLDVTTNASYATPISHNSDFTRHIFSQINTSTNTALVNSGLDNNFADGDSIVFVPKVNINTGKKLRIASKDYTLRYTDFNGNAVSGGVFIAHRPYGMAFRANDNSFIYRDYPNGMEVVDGVAHYWTGTEWKSTMKAGMIVCFANTATVDNRLYLLCDGKNNYVKTDYPELFSVIGNKYGGANNNFAVPNLKGRSVIGVDSSHLLGATGGSETKNLVISNIPSHTHSISKQVTLNYTDTRLKPIDLPNDLDKIGFSGTSGGSVPLTTYFDGEHIQYVSVTKTQNFTFNATTGGTGSGSSFNIMNPYIALNYYITTGKSLL